MTLLTVLPTHAICGLPLEPAVELAAGQDYCGVAAASGMSQIGLEVGAAVMLELFEFVRGSGRLGVTIGWLEFEPDKRSGVSNLADCKGSMLSFNLTLIGLS